MDDDGQHRPDQIGRLIAPLLKSDLIDLVYGQPREEEHGAVRSWLSRSVKRALQAVGVENAQWIGAFRAFRTELQEVFVAVHDVHVNVDVVLSWATNRVMAVEVEMDRRVAGRSNYTLRRLVRHSFNMVTGYTALPLRLASWIGGLAAILGAVLLIVVLVQYALGLTTVAGFTSTVAAISIFSGAQLVSLGLIGEYLGRQHFRGMHKPMYLVRPPRGSSDR